MSPIPTGRRQHLIHLEQSPDADSPPADWTPLDPATAWAAYDATVDVTDTDSAKTATFTFPYHAGVNTFSRILFRDERYYVRGVENPEGLNIETICTCEKAVV